MTSNECQRGSGISKSKRRRKLHSSNDKQFSSVGVFGPKGQEGIRNMNTISGVLWHAP